MSCEYNLAIRHYSSWRLKKDETSKIHNRIEREARKQDRIRNIYVYGESWSSQSRYSSVSVDTEVETGAEEQITRPVTVSRVWIYVYTHIYKYMICLTHIMWVKCVLYTRVLWHSLGSSERSVVCSSGRHRIEYFKADF